MTPSYVTLESIQLLSETFLLKMLRWRIIEVRFLKWDTLYNSVYGNAWGDSKSLLMILIASESVVFLRFLFFMGKCFYAYPLGINGGLCETPGDCSSPDYPLKLHGGHYRGRLDGPLDRLTRPPLRAHGSSLIWARERFLSRWNVLLPQLSVSNLATGHRHAIPSPLWEGTELRKDALMQTSCGLLPGRLPPPSPVILREGDR